MDGGDFRVGGVKAGTTSGFDLEKQKGEPPHAIVTAEVTEPGIADFRKDATLRDPAAVADRRVLRGLPAGQLRPAAGHGRHRHGPGRADRRDDPGGPGPGHHAPPVPRAAQADPDRARHRPGRPPGRPARGRARAPIPACARPRACSAILGRQNRIIENFIRDADTVIAPLERAEGGGVALDPRDRPRRRGVGHPPRRAQQDDRPAARRSSTSCGRRWRAWATCPTRASRCSSSSSAPRPTSTSCSRASARSRRRRGPRSTRSARRARRARDAFEASDAELAELRALSKDAPAFAKPLRQFLQTMDDRKRGLEDDARAKAGAPPAPDPTAIPDTGPFTGLEAIWNYPFWQTLSVNMFDGDGAHRAPRPAARRGLLAVPEQPVAGRHRQVQPVARPRPAGHHDARPDRPGGAGAARVLAESGKPAERRGERRGPGEPEAGPLPGQRDISKPQVVLPPAHPGPARQPEAEDGQTSRSCRSCRSSRTRLSCPNAPQVPVSPDSAESLLDFLLGP